MSSILHYACNFSPTSLPQTKAKRRLRILFVSVRHLAFDSLDILRPDQRPNVAAAAAAAAAAADGNESNPDMMHRRTKEYRERLEKPSSEGHWKASVPTGLRTGLQERSTIEWFSIRSARFLAEQMCSAGETRRRDVSTRRTNGSECVASRVDHVGTAFKSD